MDPTITYIEMLDDTRTADERAESAENLLGWIRSGGFLPIGAERREVMLNIESTLLVTA